MLLEENNGVNFAQQAYAWLKQQDIKQKSRLRLSRIFKAAGPGQVQDAYELATCVTDETNLKILETTLWGILKTKMDVEPAKDILKSMNYHIPKMENKRAFLRSIEGALEILHPGSFRFTKEEYINIKKGLLKRMDNP